MLRFLEDDVLREATSEAARHLQALVRFDTLNPPGNERPGGEYLARVLAERVDEHDAWHQRAGLAGQSHLGDPRAVFSGDATLHLKEGRHDL